MTEQTPKEGECTLASRLAISPGLCVRPRGAGTQVWEVTAVNYQRGTITIVRDWWFQKTVTFQDLEELVRLDVVHGQVKEYPLEAEQKEPHIDA
jgi:hypothetical protein